MNWIGDIFNNLWIWLEDWDLEYIDTLEIFVWNLRYFVSAFFYLCCTIVIAKLLLSILGVKFKK